MNQHHGSFIIDRDVPIPADDGRGRKSIYPFRDMLVGDSFFAINNVLRRAASLYGKRHNKVFTVRKVTEDGVIGYRCWRVK